jgi:hypothetical protein
LTEYLEDLPCRLPFLTWVSRSVDILSIGGLISLPFLYRL